MTRDTAVQVLEALVAWHDADHGLRWTCVEGERFGYRAAALVDAHPGQELAMLGMPPVISVAFPPA